MQCTAREAHKAHSRTLRTCMVASAACRSGRSALRRKPVSSAATASSTPPLAMSTGSGEAAMAPNARTAVRRVISLRRRSSSTCMTAGSCRVAAHAGCGGGPGGGGPGLVRARGAPGAGTPEHKASAAHMHVVGIKPERSATPRPSTTCPYLLCAAHSCACVRKLHRGLRTSRRASLGAAVACRPALCLRQGQGHSTAPAAPVADAYKLLDAHQFASAPGHARASLAV